MIKNSSKFYFSWLAVILIIAGLLCGSLFAVQQVGRNHANEWKAEAMEAGYNNPIYTVCRGTNPVEYNGEVYIQLMTSENSDSEDFTYYFIPYDTKLDYQTDKPNSIVILADDTSETLMINNQEVTLIDKNILLSFANDIGDHTFIKAVIDLTVTNKNIFYKISSFVDSVNTMSDLVKNYIETGNSKLLVFEKMETDALHYMENNELSDEELLKEAKHIKNIRLKRREFKNIFVLSGKAKGIICENGSHSEALRDIANKLDLLAKDLYNKTYICRSELTEQEKKDILN